MQLDGAALGDRATGLRLQLGGKAGCLGSIGVRSTIDGAEAGERFSLVEHPMSARALAAPLHRHTREDEYRYVFQGPVDALLGEEVLVGSPGDLIFRPRSQWHTFGAPATSGRGSSRSSPPA
jgi:quercetin dioxygenase-like cupin family protein